MKGFFDKLFGRNSPPEPPKKHDQDAALNPPKEAAVDPYTSGDVIAGKYEVRRVLGKGGCGIVYLVRLRETGEDFALKTFKDELTSDPAARETFKGEALVWVNLERHPFILPAIWVEDIGHVRIARAEDSGKLVMDARSVQEQSGRLLVIMDYVEADAKGRATLGDYLASGSLDENQVLTWGIQFCLGMEHARAHGLECHRDIKPANIMISQDGTLKVSDFGLAIATESALRGIVEAEGKALRGTPGYIAPEVCRGEGASVRSDIYSFGLVLWQMAAGSPSPPFRVPRGADTIGYMRAVYAQQVSGGIPRLDGPLGVVIERCLQPAPSERFGSFQELRAALEPLLERKTGRKFEMPRVAGTKAAFWNNKGGSLAALGRHEEAICCYDTALDIEPQSTKIWNNKGSALSALGRRKEALECFDRALTSDPRFAMAWENKGRELHILGRLEEALPCYDKALSLDSRDPGAWQRKGLLLAAMGKHADALACYDRALAQTPRDPASLFNKGRSMMSLGREAEALTCFDQLLEIDSGVEGAWLNKGNLLATSGRHEDAVSCFDRAIAINSANADAHNDKATSLAALGRREEALASCDRALKVDPRHADAWVGKGAVLAATGKVADAVACYDKALAIDAKNVIAWCRKGGTLASSGNHSQALVCFDRALAMKPQNAAALFAVLFGKAISEEMLGRLSDAANTLRRIIEVAGPTYAEEVAAAKKHLSELVRRETKDNEAADRLNSEGLAFMQLGRFDDALICYDKALEIAPLKADVWCHKGNVLSNLGRGTEAIGCYDKALVIDPKNPGVWGNKAITLGGLGRHEEALACCDKALQYDPRNVKAWSDKGTALASLDRYEDAIVCFQEAQKLGDPTAARKVEYCRKQLSPSAGKFFRRGNEFQDAGNNTEAIRCYDAGLAIDGSNVDLWINKGAALLALNRNPEAVACFDRVLSLNPRDFRAWNNKAHALFLMGQQDEGVACLIKAKELEKQ